MLKPVSVNWYAAAPNPESEPDCAGGTGRVRKVPFATSAGEAGFVCQFRFVTVMLADNGTEPAVALTVPPVTIVPDQVRLPVFVERVTVLLLLSVNFQPDTVTLVGVTVHVAVPPRATEDVQLSLVTLSPPVGE